MNIVFFGTPEFAVESLDAIVKAGFDVVAAVTMPDKPAGRGHRMYQSPVKEYAVANGIKLLQPVRLKDPGFLDELRALGADLFVVIAFRMLPEAVWQMPPKGTFNLHASLLPRYRGAAPINWAVMNGDTETGVTTFFLKHEIDTGDIIRQERITIGPDENVGSVHDRLMTLGAEMTFKTVAEICEGSLQTRPQPEGDFIAAPKIFRPDCEIDWNAGSRRIHDHVRGLSPYPAARTTLVSTDGKQTEAKVFETKMLEDGFGGGVPGEIIPDKRRLLVRTADGALEIMSLQPAGKKRMDASAFLLGYSPARCEKSVL